MEVTLPQRLLCNEILAQLIDKNVCDSCSLHRRSEYTHLPSGELDSAIWSSKDIFGLSLNVFLCNTEDLGVASKIDDVRIVSYDKRNVDFVSDIQLVDVDISEVSAKVDQKVILKMIFKSINKLSGAYPFGQIGTEKYTEFQYELRLQYKPLLFNPFHFEVNVYSSENEFQAPLGREKLKGYQKSLASSIRNRIFLDKLIVPLSS